MNIATMQSEGVARHSFAARRNVRGGNGMNIATMQSEGVARHLFAARRNVRGGNGMNIATMQSESVARHSFAASMFDVERAMRECGVVNGSTCVHHVSLSA